MEDTTRVPEQFKKQAPRGGKSAAFVAFFEKELIPKIDGQYRIVPGDRLLMGHGFGAVFTIETGLANPQVFSKYLALAPMVEFADSAAIKLAEEKIRSDYDPPVRMYLVIGENDRPHRFAIFEKLSAAMGTKAFKNLRFRSEVLSEPDHARVIVPGAQSGLKFLYENS